MERMRRSWWDGRCCSSCGEQVPRDQWVHCTGHPVRSNSRGRSNFSPVSTVGPEIITKSLDFPAPDKQNMVHAYRGAFSRKKERTVNTLHEDGALKGSAKLKKTITQGQYRVTPLTVSPQTRGGK